MVAILSTSSCKVEKVEGGLDFETEEGLLPEAKPIVQPIMVETEGTLAVVEPSFNRLQVSIGRGGESYDFFSVLSGKYFLRSLKADVEVRVPIIVENRGKDVILADLSFRRPDRLLEGSRYPSDELLRALRFEGDVVRGSYAFLEPESLSVIYACCEVTSDMYFDQEEVWASISELREGLSRVEYCCRLIFVSE